MNHARSSRPGTRHRVGAGRGLPADAYEVPHDATVLYDLPVRTADDSGQAASVTT